MLWPVDENNRVLTGSSGIMSSGLPEVSGIKGTNPDASENPFNREKEFSWENEAPAATTGAAHTARASRAEMKSTVIMPLIVISNHLLYHLNLPLCYKLLFDRESYGHDKATTILI